MSDSLDFRVMFGRLLEQLAAMENSARAARTIVQDAVNAYDQTRNVPLPTTRNMIMAVLKASGNRGLTRGEVVAAIKRDYGWAAPPNTATTTLLRMQRDGQAVRRSQQWFLTT